MEQMTDIVDWLRSIFNNDRSVELRCREAADTIEELTSHIEDLVTKCEQLQHERDEARRRYCFAMAEHGEQAEAQQTAKDEGWDCFKEKES
jgi:regulator of replication initiation timing